MRQFLSYLFPEQSSEVILMIAIILTSLSVVSAILFAVRKIKPELNITEIVNRTKSWWIMVTIFICAIFINNTVAYVCLAVLSFFAFRELYSVLHFRQSDRNGLLVALLAIPIQYTLAYFTWYGGYIIFIPVIMFLLLPPILVLKQDTHRITKSMAMLQWSLMLSVFGLSHLAFLLSMPDIEGYSSGGRGLLLFLVFLTEINDVMQFVWGKTLGKHKILPNVSPNKTWEGFIGGAISTTIIGYFIGFLTPLSTPQLIFTSALIAVFGFAGDVVLSAVKRDKGIKDMSDTIPGHGGIFDRIDSLSFTAPAFFHLMYFLVYPPFPSFDEIWKNLF